LNSSTPYRVHVMGEHWLPDLSGHTELGMLVTAAKDMADPTAIEQLCLMLGDFVAGVRDLTGHPSLGTQATILLAVPANPNKPDHLALHLADAAGQALDISPDNEVLVRHNATARLRDTAPSLRSQLAADAGYEVTRPLEGATVVLVDDVIMTGTTIGHIARLLFESGASRLEVVVASRTRRRS